MKKILVLAFLAFGLAACDPPTTAEPGASSKITSGEVTLMATAPDGTRLWGVSSMGRTVYFASSGTSVMESCGKNCTHELITPTAP